MRTEVFSYSRDDNENGRDQGEDGREGGPARLPDDLPIEACRALVGFRRDGLFERERRVMPDGFARIETRREGEAQVPDDRHAEQDIRDGRGEVVFVRVLHDADGDEDDAQDARVERPDLLDPHAHFRLEVVEPQLPIDLRSVAGRVRRRVLTREDFRNCHGGDRDEGMNYST
ncbi:MAG TPA: hypothetical protein VNF68_07185 [Candidatus Baltobacteraceae bacterium]|nr:hypothetical protein [Candidatus Baltobacteraceae bacterium]